MLNQRGRSHLDDDVVNTDLQIGIERVDAFAHFRCTIHFDLGGEEEVRHRPQRGDQSLRDSLSDLAGRLVAITGRGRLRELPRFDSARVCRRWFRLADRGFDISLDDSSTWATAL